MNSVMINQFGEHVFFTFSEIVEQGSISIWQSDRDSKKDKLITDCLIHHTNFKSIVLDRFQGKFYAVIVMDEQQITKEFYL